LRGKVLLPVLGDQYGIVTGKGEIALRFDAADGSFSAWYFDHRFPISPESYADILRRLPVGGVGDADAAALATLRAAPARLHEPGRASALRDDAERLKSMLCGFAERPVLRAALEGAAARFAGETDRPASWEDLHRLLEAQAYRLAYWRVAAD